MTGAQRTTRTLPSTLSEPWVDGPNRVNGQRDYAPSVLYDKDKVLYIGGGNDSGTQAPTANAEVLNLAGNPQQWRATAPMQFRRRQHNATILPDGTVLVTGGTRGGGGPNRGFNDLTAGMPVHIAELWDPETEQWTELAAERVDRCYHATATLLPDGTVLSAGGGEYRPINGGDPNLAQDSHRDAQVFSPPYLFRGSRPQIEQAPKEVALGEQFTVVSPDASDVARASLVRLTSVTHSFNANQRINFLSVTAQGDHLTMSAPATAELCPPGHYMLFLLSHAGVPSVAQIVKIGAAAPAAPHAAAAEPAAHSSGAEERRAAVLEQTTGPAVTVGITGTCPYGIGACWGGAHEALLTLGGVETVDPVPDPHDSTATVFIHDVELPDLELWREQFAQIVNGRYALRGLEMTLTGSVKAADGELTLTPKSGTAVRLAPIGAADKVQWDATTQAPMPLTPQEASAFDQLTAAAPLATSVTGPLLRDASGYTLEVRSFGSG